jgi:hypothetical protein
MYAQNARERYMSENSGTKEHENIFVRHLARQGVATLTQS